jgi:hypothetical protein
VKAQIRTTLLCLLGPVAACSALAQSAQYSCPNVPQIHQTIDCLEALFSQDLPYVHGHFIVGSVPPGNGFALGFVIEKPEHFVSPFSPEVPADLRDPNSRVFPFPKDPDDPVQLRDPGGFKSLFIPRLAAAAALNGSWYISGTGDWLPPVYSIGGRRGPAHRTSLVPCHKLGGGGPAKENKPSGGICTDQVLAIHFEGAHRVARTIGFYGIGPASPATKYTFRLDESYGGVHARMPLTNFLSLGIGIEGRHAELPVELLPASVYSNFTPAALFGLGVEPTWLHTDAGLMSRAHHIAEAKTKARPESEATPANKGPQPILKSRTAITWNGDVAGHWFHDASGQVSSFRQQAGDANLEIELGGVILQHVLPSKSDSVWTSAYHRFLASRCGGKPADPRVDVDRKASKEEQEKAIAEAKEYRKKNNFAYELKNSDYCDFGTLAFLSHIATSQPSAGATIPFFMKPTVGGQDIESRPSLRGFPDYRFRGSNAAFVQADYRLPVYDPLGLLLFYDTGNAGDSLADLSFAHARQDGGFGFFVRVMRLSLAQAYLAWGQGHGVHLGYSLTKRF